MSSGTKKKKRIIPLQELTLSNDYLFGAVMQRNDLAKLFLEELLHISIERVEYLDLQKDLSDTYHFHGVRLDVYVKDPAGAIYNVEMQTSSSDDLKRRARFYQSAIDRYQLKEGEDYVELRDSFVIFICTFDYFGLGLPIYQRTSFVENIPYDDGTRVFFLNSQYDRKKVPEHVPAAVLEFLRCVNGEDFQPDTELAKRTVRTIREVKSDPGEEQRYMTIARKMQDEFNRGVEQGTFQLLARLIASGVLDVAQGAKQVNMSEVELLNRIKEFQK